jgi:arylsulfatase A-like enzyme
LDDSVGALLKHIDDMGETNNTIVIFTTDNGAEVFTWPDGGMTPFKATKGTSFEGGFRVPAIIRWPSQVKPGSVENGIFSGLDWLPTLAAAAGNPNITEQLLNGVALEGRTYKNHLPERRAEASRNGIERGTSGQQHYLAPPGGTGALSGTTRRASRRFVQGYQCRRFRRGRGDQRPC